MYGALLDDNWEKDAAGDKQYLAYPLSVFGSRGLLGTLATV